MVLRVSLLFCKLVPGSFPQNHFHQNLKCLSLDLKETLKADESKMIGKKIVSNYLQRF